ncbi:mechanosensitive ion channel family protein [Desulforhopalus sp. 52FAK]
MKALSNWFSPASESLVLLNGVLANKWTHALLVLIAFLILSRMLQKIVARHLSHEEQYDESAVQTYCNITRFVVMVPGILLAIHILGINLSSVFTTSGLFAVALAFAMKNLAENYVSGMMLRVEQTIKAGDVLEIGGAMIRVKKIGFRDTIARSKDEKDILIPNSHLVQEKVANYTFRDSICRVWTFIGVSYFSDLRKVRQVLETVCDNFEGLSDQHAPEILLTDFGESSVNYKISVWIENPWLAGPVKSDLNEAIWWGLKEGGIKIAFPQLDVHFDKNVS